jgi:hypothetical protein
MYKKRKKKEAPVECKRRSSQPQFESWKIITTLSNLYSESAEKRVARRIPEISCKTKVRPNREPKFQKIVMLEGEGKSTKTPLIMDNKG